MRGEAIGANIMGQRMFEAGERGWPEEAPFHTPVYVLTHEKREAWIRPGGTTFYFVNDGPERPLNRPGGPRHQERAAAELRRQASCGPIHFRRTHV